MIETILIAGLTAVANRVGNRWLDGVAQHVDAQFRALVGGLISAREQPKGARREADVAKAESALRDYVSTNPAAAKVLADATLQAPSDSRIEQISAFLDYVFLLTSGMRRPLALPGFFHCADCVTVIDVRSGAGKLRLPKLDRNKRVEGQSLDFSLEFEELLGYPRVWVIPVADKKRRAAVAKDLSGRFWPDPPELTAFTGRANEFGLGDSEVPQRVERIDQDRVYVKDNDRPEGDPSSHFAIGNLDGIKSLRAALSAMVAKETKREMAIKKTLGLP